jgi:hypothetical protein
VARSNTLTISRIKGTPFDEYEDVVLKSPVGCLEKDGEYNVFTGVTLRRIVPLFLIPYRNCPLIGYFLVNIGSHLTLRS